MERKKNYPGEKYYKILQVFSHEDLRDFEARKKPSVIETREDGTYVVSMRLPEDELDGSQREQYAAHLFNGRYVNHEVIASDYDRVFILGGVENSVPHNAVLFRMRHTIDVDRTESEILITPETKVVYEYQRKKI